MMLSLEAIQESIEHDKRLRESLDSMTEEKRGLAEKYRDELIEIQTRHFREGVGKEQILEFQELRERARADGVYEEAKYLYRCTGLI